MDSLIGKKLLANVLCFILLLIYTLFGGFIFLYFERDHAMQVKEEVIGKKYDCIREILSKSNISLSKLGHSTEVAEDITLHCLMGIMEYPGNIRKREAWNLKNSLLYGFGILTTLGYGKIEPETISARMFTVVWGFFGVPFTVIILTNLGMYLRKLEKYIRHRYCRRKRHKGLQNRSLLGCCGKRKEPGQTLLGNEPEDFDSIDSINQIPMPSMLELEIDNEEKKQISPFTMAIVVLIYLMIGALVLPLLKGNFEFINGLFYSYLCFTAIEYGHLIPENNTYIPIVILYMFIGLAMSTIALDIGSNYVKKLYYLGKRVTIRHATFFYGSRNVTVKDLLVAVGQAIGISQENMDKVDLDKMVDDALLVKGGRMDFVPQNYMFLEGIWPPELIPLFARDGTFPEWVDADITRVSIRSTSTLYNNIESTPAFALSTYENGRLHRSLHSTGSSSTYADQQNLTSQKDRNNNKLIIL